MNPQIDDPILTAYALGELSAPERTAVEARLETDAEARQFVEETRAFAGELGALLKATPATDLTPEQKDAILAEAQESKARKVIPFSRWAGPVALAASIAVAFVLTLRMGEKPAVPVGKELAVNSGEKKSQPVPKAETTPISMAKELLAENEELKKPVVQLAVLPPAEISSADAAAEPVQREIAAEKSKSTGSAQSSIATVASAKPRADELLSQAGLMGDLGVSVTSGYVARGGPMEQEPKLPELPVSEANAPLDPKVAQVPILQAPQTSGIVSGRVGVLPVDRRDQFAMAAGSVAMDKKSSELATDASGEFQPPQLREQPASAPAMQLSDGSYNQNQTRGQVFANREGGVVAIRAGKGRRIVIVGKDQPALPGLPQQGQGNTEAYDRITDNEFLAVRENPLSTFSIDVDTASYANVRRFLDSGSLPPKDAVRIEELINYFDYDYPQPKGDDPFSVNVEVAPAPWNPKHLLAKIGLKGREIAPEKRPAMNLVFLLDVSGSMDEPNKLPLVRQSMKLLVERLNPQDRVAIVVYAGASGMALPSTPASHKKEIEAAIDSLSPGGSTNGAAGIQLAYDIAKANFIKDGANRVILCTDGDFNVGVTNQGDLLRLIEEKAKSNVFLTVLGFGMGNYKDSTLEKLADKGNGNYGYVDTEREAKKLLVDQLGGTLVTIAKDVKIQVEFNPAQVGAYRLIGYENRMLKAEDFNNDKKDAGEIGAGHTVTALYEITPVGDNGGASGVDPLKYQKRDMPENRAVAVAEPVSDELMTVKLRYKQPDGDTSKLITRPVPNTWLRDRGMYVFNAPAKLTTDFQFAAAVAEFGMLLRESPYKGDATWKSASDLAENGLGKDAQGYRHEFLKLIQQAKQLSESQ
jgi:Ca-activated chloride channel family protein